MSKKQIICCLAFVGVIAILMVVVLVIVRNGTEKQPSEMKMDEMEKPKKSETMTKTESTLKPGTEPNEGNTQKPFEIQICSSANQGHCECGDVSRGFQTYVFTMESEVRCFTEYIPRTFDVEPIWPLPVLFSPSCYGKDKVGGYNMIGNKSLPNRLAARYGYIRIGLSTPHGNWKFGNDGLINDEFPLPCDSSTDMSYMTAIIAWLDSYPDWYDTTRLYAEGHSQNSVFSAYLAFCFHEKFRGVWQSGSGMGLKGRYPIMPGCRAQVLDSEWAKCKAENKFYKQCIEEHPCSECQYWPIYPCYTPEKPMIDCLTEYTNDGVSTNMESPDNESSSLYMYSKLLDEGHDARLFRFSPSADGTIEGDHKVITNSKYWIIGCLGITKQCSKECEDGLLQCMESQEILTAKDRSNAFDFCMDEAKFIDFVIDGCPESEALTCAPTFEMLRAGEEPTTAEFTNFGQGSSTVIPKPDSSRCTA